MGFYSNKHKTLNELLQDAPTLLSSLQLPTGVNSASLNAVIVFELGELDTLFDDATVAGAYLAAWSSTKLPSWTRMYDALIEAYDPLHNYDRTDTETETTTGTHVESESGSQSSDSSFTGTTANGGQDTTTRKVQGYNSVDYKPSDQDITEHGASQTSASATAAGSQTSTSRDGSHADTRGRELRSVGNIGVTTSQQMLEAELELRARHTIYGIILADFKRDLCVEVW